MEHAPRDDVRRIAVCYPGDTPVVFMQAFQSMVAIETPENCVVQWFRGVGWCQARRRAHAAEQALAWNADLIACLDIDQVYEPDILKRLLARHDEGCRVIAAMVPMRGYVRASRTAPFQRLAWKIEDNEFVPIDPKDGELQKCEFPTSAAILFRAEDLKRLRRPWYFYTYKPDTWKQVHGEDASFALRLMSELGIQAWVDTTIRVKHVHPFAIDDTFSERFSDWSEEGVGDPSICGYE